MKTMTTRDLYYRAWVTTVELIQKEEKMPKKNQIAQERLSKYRAQAAELQALILEEERA